MRLPPGLKWLCAHRWRQTSTPRLYPAWSEVEWVCLDCRKRTKRNLTQPPIIYLLPGETTHGPNNPYDVMLPL